MRVQPDRFNFLVGIVLFCVLTSPQSGKAAQHPAEKQIDAIFAGITSAHEPGLAVVVRKDGRTEFIRGYGLRDLRSSLPIDEHTNFRLASFTKQFTAMAIMLLVQDGKLNYDTRLTDIFPDFPAYGHTITIRNLLNHTSGLAAYEDLMDKKYAGKSWEGIPQISDAGVLALMEQQTATKFPPGSKWEYSNSGYCVLAMVVEKISGVTFAEFLQKRIFTPLKMENTVAHVYDKDRVTNRAYGYTNDAGVWLETDQSPTSATLGDGGIYSSLDDLIKWDDALRNHTLLSAEEMRPAVTPENSAAVLPENVDDLPKAAGAKPLAYGFGWFLDPYRGHARMWHYGSSIGFHTIIQRFSTDNLTIIILANRSDLDLAALALRAADSYFPAGSYSDSSEGLADFLNSAIAATKNGDADSFASIVKATEIPDCQSWLYATYAHDSADSWMSLCDSKSLARREKDMQELLTKFSGEEGEVSVRSVNQSPQPGKGMEWGMLHAMKQPVDIYFADFRKTDASSMRADPIGYFIFIDGAFRWDSLIRFVTPTLVPAPPPSDMVKMVYPTYPPEAKQKHVQGDVSLHVLIQKDGSVKVLDAISGDPLLIPAAEKAVSQWRYKPKIVNGQPVEVDTKLVVSFRLG